MHRSRRARFARRHSSAHPLERTVVSAESQWRPCCAGRIERFIRGGKIKILMAFLPGPAPACPAVIARALLVAARQDEVWQWAERAATRLRRVACRAPQAADSPPRPAALAFPIRDLRLM